MAIIWWWMVSWAEPAPGHWATSWPLTHLCSRSLQPRAHHRAHYLYIILGITFNKVQTNMYKPLLWSRNPDMSRTKMFIIEKTHSLWLYFFIIDLKHTKRFESWQTINSKKCRFPQKLLNSKNSFIYANVEIYFYFVQWVELGIK